jgi:hypothetical protein
MASVMKNNLRDMDIVAERLKIIAERGRVYSAPFSLLRFYPVS